ncbi:hypothetical protein QT972_11735 [Microcoleus sp. herbarium7]|uniref:hypothetical protein n=1 Tax=Microcoleus sp. herbarium7 TaxID=3055435 RepID=UPI002FD05CF9
MRNRLWVDGCSQRLLSSRSRSEFRDGGCTAMSGLSDGEVGGGTFKRAGIFAERVRRMATK